MLLSAGLGTRMRPLTLCVPKPAIPVLGRPIAVEILSRMRDHGIDHAVLNLHHLPEQVVKAVGERETAGLPELRYSLEQTILGTGGGIGKAADRLRGDGPILVHNCDFLSDIDLRGVLERHRQSGMLATLVLAPPRPGYSVVEIDRDGTVLSIAGRPSADPDEVEAGLLFTGCHVIDESVLDRIPENRASCIVADVYRPLIQERKLGSVVHDGFWWEFGTPELYLQGSLQLIDLPVDRRLAVTVHDTVQEINGNRVALGAGASLQDGARVVGRAAIGLACHVGKGSEIRDSVIMPEAWIGPGSRLDRVIVGPGVEIPADSSFENVMICGRVEADQETCRGARHEGDLLVQDFAGEAPSVA
jgi:NDP-sugar pyrophosphorylase family protein